MAEERETKTFQKISEVRKKISLCEGKRRAFFNRTEKEKKINKEKTFILKDEVNVCNVKYLNIYLDISTFLLIQNWTKCLAQLPEIPIPVFCRQRSSLCTRAIPRRRIFCEISQTCLISTSGYTAGRRRIPH